MGFQRETAGRGTLAIYTQVNYILPSLGKDELRLNLAVKGDLRNNPRTNILPHRSINVKHHRDCDYYD